MDTESGMLYVVDVAIVGACKVPVVAATPEEALAKAAECVTPAHATSWDYVPEGWMDLDMVTEFDAEQLADSLLSLHA